MTARPFVLFAASLLFFTALASSGLGAGAAPVPKMAKEELKALLGSADLVLLDVRFGGNAAPSRIVGAVYEDPENVDSWAGKYSRGKKIVLYCS